MGTSNFKPSCCRCSKEQLRSSGIFVVDHSNELGGSLRFIDFLLCSCAALCMPDVHGKYIAEELGELHLHIKLATANCGMAFFL